MRTLAVILARTGSKRIKNKLFLKINKKLILDIFLKRLQQVKYIDEIIIATSYCKRDNNIVRFALQNNLSYFRGPEKNVLKRFFLSTFKSKKKPELIVRANADCALMMPTIVDKDIKSMKNKKYDLLTPFNRNFCPFGYSFVIFKPKALEKIYKRAKKRSHLEHIENYCFDNEKNFKILRPKYDMQLFYPKLKLTLDEKKDYKKIKFFYNMIKKVPIKNQPKKLISLAKSSKFYV